MERAITPLMEEAMNKILADRAIDLADFQHALSNGNQLYVDEDAFYGTKAGWKKFYSTGQFINDWYRDSEFSDLMSLDEYIDHLVDELVPLFDNEIAKLRVMMNVDGWDDLDPDDVEIMQIARTSNYEWLYRVDYPGGPRYILDGHNWVDYGEDFPLDDWEEELEKRLPVQLINPWSGAMPEDRIFDWLQIREWATECVSDRDLDGWLMLAAAAFIIEDGEELGRMIIGS